MDVSAPREVRLLGRPALRVGIGDWTDLAPGITSAVLCYLAFQRRWVGRDELIALFWPDRPDSRARGNLRPLLSRIRRDPLPGSLEEDTGRLRWLPTTDHHAFVEALAGARWREAWRLAKGDVMEGFTLQRAPEFESWLDLERAEVRAGRRTAGMRLARAALAARDHDEAVAVLSVLHDEDGFDEEVLRDLMSALASRGSRGEALAVYGRFEQRCATELGGAPAAETARLAESIRRSGVPATSGQGLAMADRVTLPGQQPERLAERRELAVSVSSGSLLAPTPPVPATPLVGRAAELRTLEQRLEDPNCRLLALVGPGGNGKTRLAIELARRRSSRADRDVAYVDLVALPSCSTTAASVAAAVGYPVDGTAGDDVDQLIPAFSGREVLLVLDNVEHLADAPEFVSRLLASSPGVSVLVTSRVSSGLAAEWTFDVAGLSWRDAPAGVRAAESEIDPGEALSDAAQLFVMTCRRARSDFAPGPDDVVAIERICASLEGSPLAIELAASWFRVLTVGQIEAELEGGLDILSATHGDRPPRHRSVRALIEQAWERLEPREQAAMRRLAVFRGGFDLTAARRVAALELPVLLALVNKSFLRRDASGRFSRHPLVLRYADERARAVAAERECFAERHSRHYLELLASRRDAYRRDDGAEMMLETETDLENVAAAWRWAAEHRDEAGLSRAIEGLAAYCWAKDRFDLLDDLLTAAERVADAGTLLAGHCSAQRALAQCYRGHGDHGRAAAAAAVRVFTANDARASLALALRLLGQAEYRGRKWRAGTKAFELGAAVYHDLADGEGEQMMIMVPAAAAATATESVRRYAACVVRARNEGPRHTLAMALSKHAAMSLHVGAFADAERSGREALRLHDPDRVPPWARVGRLLQARVAFARGRLERARALGCRALTELGREREADRSDAVVATMLLLGRIALLRHDPEEATRWAELAHARDRPPYGTDRGLDAPQMLLARVALAREDPEVARRHLARLGEYPGPQFWAGPHDLAAAGIERDALLAEVALALGDRDQAAGVARDALERARRAGLVAIGTLVLVVASRVLAADGAQREALDLLDHVARHARAPFEVRSAAAAITGGRAVVSARDLHDDGIEGLRATFDRVRRRL